MDIMELIGRQRVDLREIRQAIVLAADEKIAAALKRLDDVEMRLTKEALTGGKPTIAIVDKGPAEPGQPALGDDLFFDSSIVAPSTAREGNGDKAKGETS